MTTHRSEEIMPSECRIAGMHRIVATPSQPISDVIDIDADPLSSAPPVASIANDEIEEMQMSAQ